jgi:non-specific serine/threonine protein kinase
MSAIHPKRLGSYPVTGELGRGGMGVVYAAEDTKLKRRIALKVLSEEFSQDSERIESFRREAQLLASISHPNIATIHSLEEADGVLFITMELVPGDTLSEKTEAGPLPMSDALNICQQIAEALSAAHKNNVIHRDLKPHNIKITSEGVVKVLDFGLAQSVEGRLGVEAPGRPEAPGPLAGTPGYMSPEQLRGEPADHRSDIWAFGCNLYQCLTGDPAFPGDTAVERASATIKRDPDWTALPEETSDSLRRLLERCLEKDPEKRFESTEEALEKIKEEIGSLDLRQVGISTSPQLERPLNNLPAPLGSFVGRLKEKGDLNRLLKENRLVTLTGTGGAGKTRLALETAGEVLPDFPSGVWVVELAPLVDPDRLPQSVAGVLDIKEEAKRPLTQSIAAYLAEKSSLLILDNCEHVITACAPLAQTLLRSCPGLRIIATSREPLKITGEVVYPVPNLAVPRSKETIPLEELQDFEAVHLFVDRARSANMEFAVTEANAESVSEICRRLDGIPLALELAAARVRALPAEDIAERLSDRFRMLTRGPKTSLPHHQTLQALIDWSYDQLAESEKRLFRSLWVFTRGWTLEAAVAVCTAKDADEWEVVELHSHLVEKSLVEMVTDSEERGGRTRYRMLETIREYARARMAEGVESEEVLRRHREYFLTFAENAESQLSGADQARWMRRLDADHDNLLVALDSYSGDESGWEPALQLAGALGRYWYVRGRWSEGRDLCDRLLRHSPKEISSARAKVLNWAGNLAYCQADYAPASALHEESLEIRRKLGDRKGISASLNNLGILAQWQGDFKKAKACYEECLKVEREFGDRAGIAGSLSNLGGLCEMRGEFGEARVYYEQSLEIRRELGDQWGIAVSMNNLGVVADQQGEYDEACRFYEQGLAIRRELGNRLGIAESLNNLSIVAIKQGDFAKAEALEREAMNINLELGDSLGISVSLGLGGSRAAAEGRFGRSVRLRGAAAAIRDRVNASLPPSEQKGLEEDLTRIRQALGQEPFDRAWEEGRALSRDDAVRYALSDGDDVEPGDSEPHGA